MSDWIERAFRLSLNLFCNLRSSLFDVLIQVASGHDKAGGNSGGMHSVELITIAQAIHWFDFERFYAEAKRVLKPDGVLAAWGYGINVVEGDAVNELVQDFYGNVVGPYWPPSRKIIEDGYLTIPFPFTVITLPEFRMEVRWTMEQLLGYFSTWSATNQFIKATGRNPLEQLSAELSRVWGDVNSPRLVVWPLSWRLGRI